MADSTTTRSILIVDDDPGVLSVLSRFFQRTGWQVHQAGSGEDGLRRWDAARPDVVMLDVDLPGMSGLQVLHVLVQRGTAVIMLTGHTEVETAVEAMQAGAETFLTKPVDLAHVQAAAERAAEKQELRRTNELLSRQLAGGEAPSLGTSPRMVALARQVELLAGSADTTALLLGESGTGKSWVAQMIHARSPRARSPFVEINCAGLSATFLDSEL
ncbi:MAG: response regulator, partial [Gemmatimonadetes bacterium]|nr:response regulator [Gemmatimonadota bacterium]